MTGHGKPQRRSTSEAGRRGQRPWLRFTTTLERSSNRLWGCHIRVPQPVAQNILASGSRRVVFSLNGSADHQRALLPHGNGSYVITVNTRLRAALHLSAGARVSVRIRNDRSTYGLPMPREFRELLRQDAEGNRFFHALTPGRRRTLLYIVDSVQNREQRAFRAVIVLRHLREHNGGVNYKRLYEQLRGR